MADAEAVVKAGKEIGAQVVVVDNLELQLTNARTVLVGLDVAYDKKHNLLATGVEDAATEASDIPDTGLLNLERAQHALIMPIDCAIKHDPKLKLHRFHAKYPTGAPPQTCIIEVSSTSPPTEASYTRLPGIGVKRESSAFEAPNTYWARVATVTGSLESEWFGPVAFIVKP